MKPPDSKDVPQSDSARSRVGSAIALWGTLTLSGVSILGAFTLWHLKRRARLVRERLGPPRNLQPLTDEESS
ncbi:MAG TPA: hypothetical protein VFT74_04620 [Isosphaeraceae bacterium]|nr:hypothetical protein [Isosphaeraceae bacterium]